MMNRFNDINFSFCTIIVALSFNLSLEILSLNFNPFSLFVVLFNLFALSMNIKNDKLNKKRNIKQILRDYHRSEFFCQPDDFVKVYLNEK